MTIRSGDPQRFTIKAIETTNYVYTTPGTQIQHPPPPRILIYVWIEYVNGCFKYL